MLIKLNHLALPIKNNNNKTHREEGRKKKKSSMAQLLLGTHYFFNVGRHYKGLQLLKYATPNVFTACIISITKIVMKFKPGLYGLLSMLRQSESKKRSTIRGRNTLKQMVCWRKLADIPGIVACAPKKTLLTRAATRTRSMVKPNMISLAGNILISHININWWFKLLFFFFVGLC